MNDDLLDLTSPEGKAHYEECTKNDGKVNVVTLPPGLRLIGPSVYVIELGDKYEDPTDAQIDNIRTRALAFLPSGAHVLVLPPGMTMHGVLPYHGDAQGKTETCFGNCFDSMQRSPANLIIDAIEADLRAGKLTDREAAARLAVVSEE